jgi:hypothetical protein
VSIGGASTDLRADISSHYLTLSIPLDEQSSVYHLHYDDGYYWVLNCLCPEHTPDYKDMPKGNYVIVVTPPVINGKTHTYEDLSRLLNVSVAYYQRLGFAGHIIYLRRYQLSQLYKVASFLQLLHSGQLKIMLWDATPEVYSNAYSGQPFMNTHAHMAAWGSDLALLSIDLDEFLFLQNASTLREAWNTCMNSSGVFTLHRINAVSPKYNASSNGDLQLWSNDTDPLQHYTELNWNHYQPGKTWGMSDCVEHHGIHTAAPRSQCSYITVPKECGFLKHIVNLWRPRGKPPK